jgi:hypothetical protein
MTKLIIALACVFSFCLFTFSTCHHIQTPPDGGLNSCVNLPNIRFSDEKVGLDKEKTFKLLTDLAAAANTDAALSKTITAQASLSVKSEFSKKFNENVVASQQVSSDFWEQNITITQLYCFTEAQSKRTDLTPEQKADWNKLLMQITSDRNEYLKQRSLKKNQ